MRPLRAYLRSLDPRLPRDVYVLEAGALVNSFGNGVVLPFLLIYLHNVRGIPYGLAGSAAGVQSAAGLASGFLGGTLSDRLGPKRVLLGALAVMTVSFGLMPLIRTAWHAFAIYTLWGLGSGSFWPAQSSLLAGLTPPARRAPSYGLQRLAMNAGVALGGVVAGLIVSVHHPQTFTVLFFVDCATFVAYMLVLSRVRAPELHAERLGGLPIGLPAERPRARHVYHLYVIRTPRRAELAAFLEARDIQTGIHYPVAGHRQPAIEHLAPRALPETDRVVDEILTLPISAGHTDGEVDEVARQVRAFFSA